MRILLTDTTWNMASLSKELKTAGFFVTEAANAAELMEYARNGQQDAILIDPDLPDGQARDVLRKLRHAHPQMPICMIARKVTKEDRLTALALGADDHIQWPHTDDGDLIVRLRAFVRRAAGFSTPEIRVGDLVLNLETQKVRFGDTPVHLTRLEYELLESMALRTGALTTRDEIMLQLYAWQNEPDARIIDVYVCRLRAKFAAAGADYQIIVTAVAHGFRLNVAPKEVLDHAA